MIVFIFFLITFQRLTPEARHGTIFSIILSRVDKSFTGYETRRFEMRGAAIDTHGFASGESPLILKLILVLAAIAVFASSPALAEDTAKNLKIELGISAVPPAHTGYSPSGEGEGVNPLALTVTRRAPRNLSYNGPVVHPHRDSAAEYRNPYSLSELPAMARPSRAAQAGAALMTGLFVHELGHTVVADTYGAESAGMSFLASRDGEFHLGLSTVSGLDTDSTLPYYAGGAVASDITFEYALASYRREPTTFNKSLMLYSGLELLRYTLYSFYLSEGSSTHDTTAVVERTGLSEGALLSVALAKTAINAYRVWSGHDAVVPYFNVDRHSATFNLAMYF